MTDINWLVPVIMAGFFTKLTDDYSELKVKRWYISLILPLIYSLLMLISAYIQPLLLPLILGVTAGNVLYGKVDRLEHFIALIMTFIPLIFLITMCMPIHLIVIFMIAAYLDEYSHERRFPFFEHRLFVPIVSLLLFPEIIYFISIIFFDMGYRAAEYIVNKIVYHR